VKGGSGEVPACQHSPPVLYLDGCFLSKCHTLKYLILGCDYLLECFHLAIGFFEFFSEFFYQLFSFILELDPFLFRKL
jgi:hypothetical protein